MLERFYEQAAAIQYVLRELKNEAKIRFVSDAELDEIEGTRDLLKPFFELTEIMSGQSYVMTSKI